MFCDEFDGSSIDTSKWDVTASDDKIVFKNGVMEVTTSNAAIFDSKNAYTLGNDTYVFEARWKVDTNQNVLARVGLVKTTPYSSVAFMISPKLGKLYGGNGTPSCSDATPCADDVTKYVVTKFEVDSNGGTFYLNGNVKGKTSKCIPNNTPLNVHLTLQGEDGNPKKLEVDYIRLVKK